MRAFRTFWTDPSHIRPLFPESLLLLCRQAGFSEARALFPNGSGDLETDLRRDGEFAVIARVSK